MTIEKTNGMSSLAWDNWVEILDLIEGLWPTRARKEMSPELVKLWRERLGNFETLTVIGAIKEHAASITFFPKLNQIVQSCKSRMSSSHEKADELKEKCKEYEKEMKESKKEMNLILSNVSIEELNAHKEAELIDNPILNWMKNEKSTTLTWKMLIAKRIKSGAKPQKKVSELPDI